MAHPPIDERTLAAATLLADPAVAVTLRVDQRQAVLESMATPKQLGIPGSTSRCYVHSVTEDGRIRKFKEAWTIDWMRQLPDGAVLYDVGANIGITTLLATENRARLVRVVAIEPAPANFASLVKNIALNGLSDRIYPLAIGLGADSGVVALQLVSLEPGIAMHAFGDFLRLESDRHLQTVARHFCPCLPLDELVRWNGLPFPTHVKIDVDGAEWDVIRGGERVFADPRLVGVQVEIAEPESHPTRVADVVAFMARAGLTEVARYPRRQHAPYIADCQFARPSADRG
jgi:FkbM family methyltransferase